MKNKLTPALGLCLAFLLVLAQPAAGLLGGEAEPPATATMNPRPEGNGSPVARDQTIVTYPDLPVCGQLRAMDPDREPVTFEIVTQPEKGAVELLEEGIFRYTPTVKKGAKDKFTFLAQDPNGNRSAPATVTVEIRKRPEGACLRYSDMTASTAHFAAVRLAEEGSLRGQQIGASNFFFPEQKVTRSEFVTMVAAVCDLPLPTSSISTGMLDDASIPAWAQSSVVAAISEGIIKGGTAEGRAVFRGEDPITRAEAAAILDRALGLTDDGRSAGFSDAETVPVWASQALINTTAAGILSTDPAGAVKADAAVTREDAADMLYAALCWQEAREEPGIWEKLFG